MSGDAAGGWAERAAYHLQQSGFAAAIATDDADGLASIDLERNIFQRPEFAVILLWRQANETP